ncbi:MAG: class I SAM-dependent methyltransferase [Bryobacterales bacterium]|nr:class I SAM-dependent methyltransferase [Bryobacterales bacterium]
MKDSVAWYNKHASAVTPKYESVNPDSLHDWMTDLLPEPPALVLDVGSGTGRDAAWFASKGFDVFAVEPSRAMREIACTLHPSASVCWMNDSLPGLDSTYRKGVSFDMILVNAVWMHLPPGQRQRAFRKLVNLLKPGGIVVISLRIGPTDADREMYPIDGNEIPSLARNHGTIVQRETSRSDLLGRESVHWTNYALRLPDDGTDALPLLRHVILNDSKSSTYKLGLLRSVCRIADGAAGLTRRLDDDWVSVPLGLVALTWLRLYKPLLDNDFPQSPQNFKGGLRLGFAGSAFEKLAAFSNLDLRVGMRVGESSVGPLHHALRDVAKTIQKMPAKHMTFPDGKPILPVRLTGSGLHAPNTLVLDEDYLRSFGEMWVPWRIWQSLQRFTVWVEPALVEEWIRLMQQYGKRQDRVLPKDRLAAAMTWADPTRDVGLARQRAGQLLGSRKLYCVWSGKALSRNSLNMDHCFPWSAWPCSDLWNLMPTNHIVNMREKKAQLPSAHLMVAARDRIMSWWEAAYGSSDPAIHERFVIEATSSLPGIEQPSSTDLDKLFGGALAQRARLRNDQKIPEWTGDKYL